MEEIMKMKLLFLALGLSTGLIHSMEKEEKVNDAIEMILKSAFEKSLTLQESDKELIPQALNGNLPALFCLQRRHMHETIGIFWESLVYFISQREKLLYFVKNNKEILNQIHEKACTLYQNNKVSFDKNMATYLNQPHIASLIESYKKHCKETSSAYAGIVRISNNNEYMPLLNLNYFAKLIFMDVELEEIIGSFDSADKKWKLLIITFPKMGKYYKDNSQLEFYQIHYSNHLSQRGEYEKVIQLLEPLSEKNLHVTYNCARAYQAQNKLEQALAYYHKVIALEKSEKTKALEKMLTTQNWFTIHNLEKSKNNFEPLHQLIEQLKLEKKEDKFSRYSHESINKINYALNKKFKKSKK